MFRMPIGLYEKALPDAMSWEERLAAAGQAGYDFIEISIDESDERLSRLDWSASERAALRRSIDNTGVRIMTMCLSGHRKYPLGSHSPELRRQGQEILRKAIEFAGDIGLRVGSGDGLRRLLRNERRRDPGKFYRRPPDGSTMGRSVRSDAGPRKPGYSVCGKPEQGNGHHP